MRADLALAALVPVVRLLQVRCLFQVLVHRDL